MKIAVLITALLWSIIAANAQPRPSPARQSELCEKLLKQMPEMLDLSTLSPEQRKSLTKEFRVLAAKDGVGLQNMALMYLLYFGDKKAIERIVTAFGGSDRGEADSAWIVAQSACQPLLIPAFAKFLYANDPPLPSPPPPPQFTAVEGRISDGVYVSIPNQAGTVILRILHDSKEFSKETRAWSGEVGAEQWEKDFPKKIQKWWEQNREKFNGAQYKAVEPLREEGVAKASRAAE